MSPNFAARRRLRAHVLLSASGFVLMAALAVPARAADDADMAEVDEIVVTGQREAQRAAIAVKRESFEVVDAVSADDIGKLPDHNTAAALRRIPGVSVMEDQGEPRFPTLRGLRSTYNRTTIDGAIVGSVDETGRTVPMDIVPSVMAGRLEVTKTVTPENDANAIGGIVNVTTRSAFDLSGPFVNAIASYGHYERSGEVRNDKLSYRAAIAAGRTFGAEDEWGVVVGASFEQLDYDIPQVESQDPSVREYTAEGTPVNSGAPTGNGIQVPTYQRLFWYNNTKQRAGINAKVEHRPADSLHWVVSGLFAKMEDDEERIENRLEPLGNVSNQTPVSGSFARGRGVIHMNQPITRREIAMGRGGVDWRIAPEWKADGDLVYSRAALDVPNHSVEFRTQAAQESLLAFTYDTSNPLFPVFMPLDEAAYRNPANYRLQQHRDALTSTDEASWQGRLNLAYESADARLKAKFGGLARTTTRTFLSRQTNYAASSGLIYTLDLVDKPGPSERIAGRYLLDPRVDAGAARAFLEANRDRFIITATPNTGDYEVREDVFAGYGQTSYEFGPLTVLGGLRYERTKVDSDALRNHGGVLTPVSNGGRYDNWLPSLHLQYRLTDDLVIRAAWTNTIGRPDFGQLTAGETIGSDGAQATLSRGNPNLKARESEGFDLSFEFYPTDGLVSVALFRKTIKNEIFTLTSLQSIGGVSYRVSEPQNAENAKVEGVEFAIQQAFAFLPAPFDGFGFNGNVTFVNSKATYLTSAGPRTRGLFQQPDVTSNESIYYQRGPFEARLSHNYIGGFLETIVDAVPNSDQYWKGRHLFDASVSWRLNNNITVFAEAQNISNTGRQEVTGPGHRFLQEWANYGRTYWVGLAASF